MEEKDRVYSDVQELAIDYLSAMDQYKRLSSEAAAAWEIVKHLQFVTIPGFMDENNSLSMTTTRGDVVSIKDTLSATVIKEQSDSAKEWLEANGHGGIVKEAVNSKSLASAMLQDLRDGAAVPPSNLIKITVATKGTVSRPKED